MKIETEITMDEVIQKQCELFSNQFYATKDHLYEITDWCYKLLDCMNYQGMSEALCTILDRINKGQSLADSANFNEPFITRVAQHTIDEMQSQIDKLTAELERANSLINQLTTK